VVAGLGESTTDVPTRYLGWQLLTTDQDYAFNRQTIIDRKLRHPELLPAGDSAGQRRALI
jgi:hypothetical protein